MTTRQQRRKFGLLDVDVESVVRKQSIVYENAATCWQDGHILGNGDMGVVSYAPYNLEWTVNKIDVFDSRTPPVKRLTYSDVREEGRKRKAINLLFLDELEKPPANYRGPGEPLLKSCGLVKIRTAANECSWGAPPPYQIRQTLSLWEAKNRLELRLPDSAPDARGRHTATSIAVECFVSRESNLFAVRMANASPPFWGMKVELCRPYDGDYVGADFGSDAKRQMIWFNQKLPDGTSYAMAIGVIQKGGSFRYYEPFSKRHITEPGRIIGIEQKGDRIWINLTGNVDVFVGVATSYETEDPLSAAKAIVAKGMRTGYDLLERNHRRWWAEFWKKSFIQFHDPLIEQLWYFGVYQAGSSLGRAPVPGLCGLWYGYHDLPVQGFFWAVYTLDQNVQLQTFPVFAVNHPELALPFMDTFLNALPRTIKETKALFQLPGARYPLEMGFMGGEPFFSPCYRFYGAGGLFCGMIYEWAYRYTQDRKLLKEKIYPFLKEVVRFHVAFMEIRKNDERYHTQPIVPEEIRTLTRDPIDIVSMLKPCLKLVIEASEMFGMDETDREKWKDVLKHYPAYPVRNGMLADGIDVPPDYERLGLKAWVSRLLPVNLAHEKDPEVWGLVRKTLDPRIKPGRYTEKCMGYKNDCGDSWWWITLAMLRFGMKADILPRLYGQIRCGLKPSGLMPHIKVADTSKNPRYRDLVVTTPEINSAVTMVVTEMLMQSYNGIIQLFPGVNGKATTRFGDLRAEGAFLVSAEMVRGRITFVSIEAGLQH
ncbi:MAG: hypothetical protein KKD76_00005, partial [Verrucomicrobia bacterium]|nr:hypothetical protein [Verrucomicrobiota bacterium]